jgi:hypothetical protein
MVRFRASAGKSNKTVSTSWSFTGDRWFESISLQRGVFCETLGPCFAHVLRGLRQNCYRFAGQNAKFGSTPRKAAVRSMDTPILGRRIVGRKLAATTGLIAALLVTAPSSRAAVITQMLGTANNTNGETVGTGTFASNPSGDPAPFDRLIGDKTNGPNPSTSFTFSGYGGPIASPISSATLEFGLYDGASPSPSRRPAPERDISIGEAGDVSIGDLHGVRA